MFVQYYSKLIESLRDQAYQLYRHTFEYRRYQWISLSWISHSYNWIITYFDMFSMREGVEVGGEVVGVDNSAIELLLAIQAMKLHSGRTSLLYKMLKFMESSKEDDHQQLAREIRLNIKRFDPNNSSGM